jgi:hypothetical protein
MWVLVFAESDEKYYPQSSADACQMLPAQASNGKWTANLFLGVFPPEQFDIVVAVTTVNSEASQAFKTWLKTGCDTGEFPGFTVSDLPEGLSEMDAITVRTR